MLRHVHVHHTLPGALSPFFARLATLSTRGAPRYLTAAVAVAVVVGALLAVRADLGVLNVGLIFLLLIFVIALALGSGPAVVAATLSFLAFDFFLIPPFHTFTIASVDHVLALFVYLGIAITTGQLVARVRARTEIAVREQQRTALLYELNAALIGNVTLDEILGTIVERVVQVYGASQCRILLPTEDTLTVRARFPSASPADIERQNLAMAMWALEKRVLAGQGVAPHRIRFPHGVDTRSPHSPRTRGRDALYLPIATAAHTIGVLEIVGRPGGGRFGQDDVRLLTSFANQAGLALDRARLTEEAARAVALVESDELKSALLAAVSHDLRTPLAAIKASVTSLLDSSVKWEEASQKEFLQAINEETDRLTLMVGNILDLSRIEGGALRPDKEWYDVAEVIADVANRLAGIAGRHELRTDVKPRLPLAYFDYVEIAQVLMNLGENAVKYTPDGTAITLAAHRVDDDIVVAVYDTGPGISPGKLPHLFEKFYRGNPDGRVRGAGIGLTISKGLVEAHGGHMWVASREGEGTVFHFTLPINGAGVART
jgi:two-component system, OmpR family, sensor histidine kinase KdpD